jgi:hypothetical protein
MHTPTAQQLILFHKQILLQSGAVAELVNASIVPLRDPVSNLDNGRKYFPILFVFHLNLNI